MMNTKNECIDFCARCDVDGRCGMKECVCRCHFKGSANEWKEKREKVRG
jgi:hypothetical protein